MMRLAIEQVREAVRKVGTATAAARAVADEASEVADATGQHFWADTDGVHVTQVGQDDWNDSSSSSYRSGPNMLANSLGMLLRDGLYNLASWTGGAVAFYDGLGNAAGNLVASFGRSGAYQYVNGVLRSALTSVGLELFDTDGSTSVASFGSTARIGTSANARVTIDARGMDVYTHGANKYASVMTDNDPTTGVATVTDTNSCINIYEIGSGGATGRYVGILASATPTGVVSATLNGSGTTVVIHSGSFECASAQVGDELSVTYTTTEMVGHASFGFLSHATGPNSFASGDGCHAIGSESAAFGSSDARGSYSFAEGHSMADGMYSHAEGQQTVAMGSHSHVEGFDNIASGFASHAGGSGTVAASDCQTVIGRNNVKDPSDVYALIVGNGTADNARSNALGLKWDGTLELANGINAGGTVSGSGMEVDAPPGGQSILDHHSNAVNVSSQTSTPSSNKTMTSELHYDSADYLTYYSQIIRTTADDLYRSFVLQRKDSGGVTRQHGFYMHIDSSGKPVVTFPTNAKRSCKTAWHEAISGWGSVLSVSDTSAHAISLADYTEVMVVAKRTSSPTYGSTLVIPVASLGTSAIDWYMGAWGNTYYAAFSMSKTSFTAYQIHANGTAYTASWTLYAR